MRLVPERSHTPEIMDRPDNTFEDLDTTLRNIREFRTVMRIEDLDRIAGLGVDELAVDEQLRLDTYALFTRFRPNCVRCTAHAASLFFLSSVIS